MWKNQLKIKKVVADGAFFFLLVCFLVLKMNCCWAQSILPDASKINKIEMKSHDKNEIAVSLGYGLGNVWISFLKKNYNTQDYQISAIGPFDASAEFFVHQRISTGLSFAYSKIKGNLARFLVDEQLTIFTAFVRANYHFGRYKKLDPYAGLGAGYVRAVYTNSLGIPSNNVPGNFDYSVQLGVRYYVKPHLGLYAELGYVNGSFAQVGVVCKFKTHH